MKIVVSEDLFSYDIKSLVRTFCLGEDISSYLTAPVVFQEPEVYVPEKWADWIGSLSEKQEGEGKEHGVVDQPVCLFLQMPELPSAIPDSTTGGPSTSSRADKEELPSAIPDSTTGGPSTSSRADKEELPSAILDSTTGGPSTSSRAIIASLWHKDGRFLGKEQAPAFESNKEELPSAIPDSTTGGPSILSRADKEELTASIPDCTTGGPSTSSRADKEELHASIDRRGYKNEVKRVLFRLLKKVYCDQEPFDAEGQPRVMAPAWGTLTGVRPTKLPMEYLYEGMEPEKVRSFLKKEYLCSDSKLELAMDIAVREKALLDRISAIEDGYSLYIGIPFCPTTCHYCSFASFSLERFAKLVPEYLEALHWEIDQCAELMKEKRLCCVYFGGGTPTSLSAEQLEELISHIKRVFDFSDVMEFTVEAGRPDTITQEKLEVLSRLGVNRISINPQTMQQRTLDLVGRGHTTEQIVAAMKQARKLGFDNINMDLIVGLPGESLEDVRDTLEKVEQMSPDSLTVHSMVLKRAAKLNQVMSIRETTDAGMVDEMVDLGLHYAKKMGQHPYYMYRQKNAQGSRNQSRDNIGYAREGKEGLYNIIIMEEKQTILALGAGTVTKRVFFDGRIERCDSVKDVKLYIQKKEEMFERKKVLMGLL